MRYVCNYKCKYKYTFDLFKIKSKDNFELFYGNK